MSSADEVRTVEEEQEVEAQFYDIVTSNIRRPDSLFKDVLRDGMRKQKRIDNLESLNAILEANLLSFKELTEANHDMEGQLILVKHIADEATPPWAKLQAVLIPGKDLIK